MWTDLKACRYLELSVVLVVVIGPASCMQVAVAMTPNYLWHIIIISIPIIIIQVEGYNRSLNLTRREIHAVQLNGHIQCPN